MVFRRARLSKDAIFLPVDVLDELLIMSSCCIASACMMVIMITNRATECSNCCDHIVTHRTKQAEPLRCYSWAIKHIT